VAEFAVIGVGRFGRAVARSLALAGQAVLAVDRDRRHLEQVADEVDSVVEADVTDERSMRSLDLGRMSCVVVTIGSRALEASLLTTAILRDLEVPRIVARSFDERHARLLLAIGAHEVLNPEDEIGRRLALSLAHPGVRGQLQLGERTLAEVEAPEAFAGHRLDDLDLLARHGVAVLAIRRGDALHPCPAAELTLESGDTLLLVGDGEALERLAARK
jgi:trk system potassium uptake protein TrkA